MSDAGITQQVGHRWWLLATIAVAQLMISLDTVVMNVALPSVQRDLLFGDSDREWIITAYLLSFGGLLLLSGRLADRFGRRNLFLGGLIGFAIASGIGGASTSFGMLVVCRAVQGAFAAALAPAALSLLSTTFPGGRDRARAFGIFGSVGVSGSAIGLVIGGTVTQYLSWRWTMGINIVFAVPAILGALVLLHNSARGDNRGRIDFPSVVLVSAGLFGVVFGISSVSRDGWNSPVTIGFLAVGVALLIVFVLVQRSATMPLLPLRVPLDRSRGAGYLGILLGSAGMLSVMFILTFYVQGVLRFSAVQTGIAFLPLPLALVVVGAVIGPRLSRRFGPRVLVPIGMVLGFVSALLLTRITSGDNYAGQVLPSLIILGIGLGLVLPTSVSAATFGVRKEDAGVASALASTTQQVGGALAVAIFNTVAATATAAYLVGSHPTPRLLADAAVHGYTIVFGCIALMFLFGATVTALLSRPERASMQPVPVPSAEVNAN